jgi:hypothetical protein
MWFAPQECSRRATVTPLGPPRADRFFSHLPAHLHCGAFNSKRPPASKCLPVWFCSYCGAPVCFGGGLFWAGGWSLDLPRAPPAWPPSPLSGGVLQARGRRALGMRGRGKEARALVRRARPLIQSAVAIVAACLWRCRSSHRKCSRADPLEDAKSTTDKRK